MYPVSPEFTQKIAAGDIIHSKLQIDFTSPTMDQSIVVQASEQGNTVSLKQTADGLVAPAAKYISLDGSWVADGTWGLAPGAEEVAQMGWWGKQLADSSGEFAAPYPTLSVSFMPRPLHSLTAVGDSRRGEYPVDFTVKLYNENDEVLHTETVAGNEEVEWGKNIDPVPEVAKVVLEITKWSHPGRAAKIVEFFTSIQEVYGEDEIISIDMLEERETVSGGSPVGNISSNELRFKLVNENGKFDMSNPLSPLYKMLKPNRRVRAWAGYDTGKKLVDERVRDQVAIVDDFEEGTLDGLVFDTDAGTLELEGKFSPGPNTLAKGTMAAGYFGEVSANDLITGEALCEEIGLTQGYAINSNTNWLKYAYGGKVLFVAKLPIRYMLSWNALNLLGCIFGTKTIKIGDITYKVRVLRGANSNPPASPLDVKASEWNALMLPVHVNAPDNWSADYVDIPTADWETDFTSNSMGFGLLHGQRSICQETYAGSWMKTYFIARGGYNPYESTGDYTVTTINEDSLGFRPVLEVSESGYNPSGTRISDPIPLPSNQDVQSAIIVYSSQTPPGATVTVEAGISSDAETEPTEFTLLRSGSSVPGVRGDMSGHYLWFRQTLATYDETVTPTLYPPQVILSTLTGEISFIDAEPGEYEYVPLGIYWTSTWDAPQNKKHVAITCYDRIDRLRGSVYTASKVKENVTLYDLAVDIFENAGLSEKEYFIDLALKGHYVPYGYFAPQSYRDALRLIAEASLGQVYCDRDGVIRVEGPGYLQRRESVLTIQDYYSRNTPAKYDEIINSIEVEPQPLTVGTAEEVYRSNVVETIGAETVVITVNYNNVPCVDAEAALIDETEGVEIESAEYYSWGAEVTVTSDTPGSFILAVTAKPLKVTNRIKVVAEDPESIEEHTKQTYKFPANPLVQTTSAAQLIADTLIGNYSETQRDSNIEWQGNLALEITDRVEVVDSYGVTEYYVIQQELSFTGRLRSSLTGRKV